MSGALGRIEQLDTQAVHSARTRTVRGITALMHLSTALTPSRFSFIEMQLERKHFPS